MLIIYFDAYVLIQPQGPDYDSSSETEMALEEARLNALVQHWESASLTASLCSSASRSLQGTPVRQAPMRWIIHQILHRLRFCFPIHGEGAACFKQFRRFIFQSLHWISNVRSFHFTRSINKSSAMNSGGNKIICDVSVENVRRIADVDKSSEKCLHLERARMRWSI